MNKHLLSITDLTAEEILKILNLAKELKEKHKQAGESPKLLQRKILAMIFEKPSLRTRLSFEIAMQQLGGHAVYLGPSEIGLGTREPVSDIAKVVSSMADAIMARTFDHKTIVELAQHAAVPVINGLSDLEHPCQILADLLTIYEHKGTFKNIKVAFIGDGENNVTHSLTLAATLLGMHISVAAPKVFWMKQEIVKTAQKIAGQTGSNIIETDNSIQAVTKADVVYTDTWVSMGDETEKEKRLSIFKKYQVTAALMSWAKPNAIFMHDMPAYRGNEVTKEVIDGPQSVVFEQAENRLHAQKALLVQMLAEPKN
jgi:ornithine carbamoyltransferase